MFNPEELGALKSAFDEACRAAKIPEDSIEAENLAQKLLTLFETGISDHGKLLEAVTATDGSEDQSTA